MDREMAKGLSQELRDALDPLLAEIESLNERIAEYDGRIEQIAKEIYPQVAVLKQVKGVRPRKTVLTPTGLLVEGRSGILLFRVGFLLSYAERRSRDSGCGLALPKSRTDSGCLG
jgi:hypothetical protein